MRVCGADRLLHYLQNTKPVIKKDTDQRIFTFDIEASNGYIINGIACQFDYEKSPAFYNSHRKAALCYLWQFGVDDVYFYGRHIEDLIPVWDYLAQCKWNTICFVHNFSYEFATLIGYIHFNKVFARSPHKPITASAGHLQFRCTYMLTRQKLEDVGASVGYPKLVDNMEYDSIRTPDSVLSAQELDYAIRDLEILYAFILKMRTEYKLLQTIPLTQTGRPRKEVKKIYAKDWHYHQRMTRLLPKDAAEYKRLKAAFIGGWVHANYYWVDTIMQGKFAVTPWDITSSYPLQMILHKYPAEPWTHCDDPESFERYLSNKNMLCLCEVTFNHVWSCKYNDYISYNKTYDREGVKHENGRVYAATHFKMFITCVDLEIIRDCYQGEITVTDLYYSRASYLDKRYVLYILELYNNKVQLTNTGDPVKDELRARSKELLNALYGMMVSSLIYPEITFNNKDKGWTPRKFNSTAELDAYTNDQLDKLRQKPWKNFQSFSAGLFVTAYGRKQLYDAVGYIDKDVVYHDTDSVYCKGDYSEFFDAYNEDLKRQLIAMCHNRGIDPDLLHPKDPNGEEQWIGIYVSDTKGKPLHEFKTLGAKRYAYREISRENAQKLASSESDPNYKKKILKKSQIKITISGVNKSTGSTALNDDLNELNENMVFDYKECGKLIPHYLTDMGETVWIDRDGKRYVSHQSCGVCLQPARYIPNMGDFFEVLASMGSLSNQYSEMEIAELMGV